MEAAIGISHLFLMCFYNLLLMYLELYGFILILFGPPPRPGVGWLGRVFFLMILKTYSLFPNILKNAGASFSKSAFASFCLQPTFIRGRKLPVGRHTIEDTSSGGPSLATGHRGRSVEDTAEVICCHRHHFQPQGLYPLQVASPQ